MNNIIRINDVILTSLVILGMIALPQSAAADQEGIVLDPATGNYTITYYGVEEPHSLEQVVWVPATNIDPVVRSRFQITRQGAISYSYEIKNRPSGKQPIDAVILGSPAAPTNQMAPPHWMSTAVPNSGNPNFARPGYVVGWSYNYGKSEVAAGIEPRESLHGFRVDSLGLPGVGIMQLSGATPIQGFPDEGPDSSSPVGQQFDQLNDHNYIPRYAAVPWISVPNPYVAAPVLAALQRHIDQDLVGMKLIDSGLVARLDLLFQSAIAAAQGGNYVALRADLRALRSALNNERSQEEKSEAVDHEREAEDAGDRTEVSRDRPIAKIAQAVLEFDLHYLEWRAMPH